MASSISAGNATNGLAISSDNTGIIELKTGTGAGTTALTLSTAQNATFAGAVTSAGLITGATGALYPVARGTAVASTSGTSIDFTSIPSWVKRITLMLNAVSLNAAALPTVRIGSGSFVSTGYSSAGFTASASATGVVNYTSGFVYGNSTANFAIGASLSGTCTIVNISGDIWVANGLIVDGVDPRTHTTGGTITLSGALDRLQLTTLAGTATFDAGSINILYE